MAAKLKHGWKDRDKVDIPVDLSYLPEKLRKRLMSFQKEGVEFAIKKDGRCLIADEMGLGKTLQALSIALYYQDEWPLLIIVPSSLRYPWIEEIEKWLPQIDPQDVNLIQNGGDISDISRAKVTIVTFGLLRNPSSRIVQEALLNQKFSVVIVDESHYMKNRRTATSKYLVPLIQNASRRMLLTGTPALSRPEELFPQVEAIAPKEFGNWSNFSKRYCNAHMVYFGRGKRWCTDGASNLHELQTLLSDKIMIRRLKKDVLTQLPPKQRQRIPFELKDSVHKKDLDSTWIEMEKVMNNCKMDMVQALRGGRGGAEGNNPDNQDTDSFEIRKLISQLFVKTATAKIGPVKEYVKMLCDNQGLKFLVFAYHHSMMNGIAECLHDEGISYMRIDGKTPPEERPRLVKQFQVDPNCRVAILSIKAAGVGLTLTAAKLVVFAELDWTPGVLEQCEDRAHRIGQQDTVHIHYLVAKGSLDEWVWSALTRKTAIVTTTLNGQRQVLRMEKGYECQIKVLANADAWIPSQKPSSEDISTFFQSQRPRSQKSLLEFFTPKSKQNKHSDEKNISDQSPTKSSTANVPKCKPESSDMCGDQSSNSDRKQHTGVVLIDSDSDCDKDFKLGSVKRWRKHSHNSESSDKNCNPSLESDELPDLVTPKRRHQFLEGKDKKQSSVSLKGLEGNISHDNVDAPLHISVDNHMTQNDTVILNEENIQENDWSCKMCTFINNEGLLFCEMCNSPKLKNLKRLRDRSLITGKSLRKDAQTGSRKKSTSALASKFGKSKSKPLTSYLSPRQSNHCNAEDSFTHIDKPVNSPGSPLVTSCDTEMCDSDTTIVDGDAEVEIVIDDASDVDDNTCEDSRGVSTQGIDMEIGEFDSQHLGETSTAISEINPTPEIKSVADEGASCNISHVIEAELAAARKVFSPGFKKASDVLSNADWRCPHCKTLNDPDMDDCDGCFKAKPCDEKWACGVCKSVNDMSMEDCDGCFEPRPAGGDNCMEVDHKQALSAIEGADDKEPISGDENRVIDLDQVPVFNIFKYCCSKNSSRVYLYNSDGQTLNVNFTPLDVEMSNYGDLPDLMLHPQNLRLIKRFVREWKSLSLTKQRIVIRSGELFSNPCLFYEELKSGKKSTQRYTSKADVAVAAMTKAQQIGGSVRVVTRPDVPPNKKRKRQEESVPPAAKASPGPSGARKQTSIFGTLECTKSQESQEEILERMKGIVQAVDADGNPLCIHCHKRYRSDLVTKATMASNPWATRFCSKECMEQYWLRRHREYGRKQVYEVEQGICQLCGFDAHRFFERLRITNDLRKRAKLVQESKYKDMKISLKEKMVRNPFAGLFWHVDHITAVSEGGGECDMDNLRTLCTPCHQEHTAQQTKERAQQTKFREAANCHDITAFFQPPSS